MACLFERGINTYLFFSLIISLGMMHYPSAAEYARLSRAAADNWLVGVFESGFLLTVGNGVLIPVDARDAAWPAFDLFWLSHLEW
ncbi:uncharacterized protein BDW70DRAFT_126750, partial [Aspergillus foveolatus]|uniref:uncharacterized protein n=1 Tax=Aspergillus foveolatus TaxID=210207 RepID=UPI003CCDAE7E